jgi:hypothetical protein
MSGYTVMHRVIPFAIVANTVMWLYGLCDDTHEAVMERCHVALLALFVIEVVMLLHTQRLHYFTSPWSCFDLMVIVLSLLPMLGVDASVLRVARLARMVHLGRHRHGAVLMRLWGQAPKACHVR